LSSMPTGDGSTTSVDIPTATPETLGINHSAQTTTLALRSALLTELIKTPGSLPTVSNLTVML